MPLPSARRRAVALGASLLFTALVGPARAADPSDSEVSRRIDWIQDRLDRGTPAAQRWWYAWYSTFTALSVGQVGVALGTTNKGLRTDAAFGAVTSSLGLVPLMVVPYRPLDAATVLRGARAATAEERRRKLARAERLLHKCAETEALGGSWIAHVLGGTVAITSGVVLAAGYHRIAGGILNAVVGVGITETQIFTRPTAAIDDLRAYKAASASPAGMGATAFDLSITALPGGGAVAGRF